MAVKYSTYFVYMYFEINGVKYWVLLTPSGLLVYKKEGSKTRCLGRRPLEEVKRLLAQADAETLQRIKSDIETIKLALERQKPTQKTQTTQPSFTWKKDGHTYWLVLHGRTVYIYMKGPSTRHRPKLVEKTDVAGAVDRLAAAGAAHVLEALRALVNDLHAAVADLLKPQTEKTPDRARRETPRVSRREAEKALAALRKELSRAVNRWDEEWRMKARDWGGPDREWLREKLRDFVDSHIHLLEKIQPYEDLLDKFADAVAEATAGHLTRSDVLSLLAEEAAA